MAHLILILVPTSMLGLLAIALFLAPRTAIASETAATITKTATAAAYTGASVPVVMGFTIDQWSVIGIVGGLILGALTWVGNIIVNAYFKQQHLRLAIRQAEAGKPIPEGD